MTIVSRDRAEAVCEGLKKTFPGTDAPKPRDNHFDSKGDVVVIHNDEYVLRVSEQCFQYHEDHEIVAALLEMEYADYLRKVIRLNLGCAPAQAPTDQAKLASWGDWYLFSFSN